MYMYLYTCIYINMKCKAAGCGVWRPPNIPNPRIQAAFYIYMRKSKCINLSICV